VALRLGLRGEGRRVRLISEQPRFTMLLRSIDLGLMPRDVREWVLGWLEDVETAVRSREAMVSFITFLIYSNTLSTLLGGVGLMAPGLTRSLRRLLG
jgi:hypothetical protein